MVETCEMCGATEKIQRHHTSYEPEIIQFLCVDCHKTIHNHGVGKAPGWTSLFEWLKEDAEILFKEGATNDEVANACDISYATASHWRGKLGFIGATKIQKGKERESNFDVTVKISGNALKQIITVRGNREKHIGRIISIAELVREAIECWYDLEGQETNGRKMWNKNSISDSIENRGRIK